MSWPLNVQALRDQNCTKIDPQVNCARQVDFLLEGRTPPCEYGMLDRFHLRSVQFSIQKQLLRRNVKRFRGGLVFKAHKLLIHSTLGWKVIKKKKKKELHLVVGREEEFGGEVEGTLIRGVALSLSLSLSHTHTLPPLFLSPLSLSPTLTFHDKVKSTVIKQCRERERERERERGAE